ncbi:MAG: T9SS type A sorting domain-containing protein [Bacteroidales bacterium]|nr:T9SS type A sorting domain-containing protein [Bacteroidales bacterium]
MRKLFLLLSFVIAGYFVQSQSLYTDGFETYTTGGFIAAQNADWWTTWSNMPGGSEDGEISTAFAHGGTKAVLIDEVPSASDVIMKLGNKTSGKYELKWWMYVENNKAGYYNIQHFQSPGTEWAFEVYLLQAGGGELLAGSATPILFNYPKATWFEVKHMIDLDADNIKLYINGVMVHTWPFSYQAGSTTGTKQLGGVNFYAGAKTGESPKYFIDDVDFAPAADVLLFEDMEAYAVDAYLAQSNPTWFTTWSNAPGTAEDARIKNTYGHSPTKSALVDKTGGDTDLVLKLGNKTTGKYEVNWWMYVETGFGGYYNFQHFQSPGTEWAMEVYLLTSGGGELLAGSATPILFNYPKATWFECKHIIDLDADNIKMYINGVMVHEWPFSYQAGSTTGTLQLGGVNFYAGAKTGETAKYFIDDVYVAQLAAASDPIIEVSPTSMTFYVEPGGSKTDPLTITNTGAADLTWNFGIVYNADLKNTNAAILPTITDNRKSLGQAIISDPTPNPASWNPISDDVVLNYDGDQTSAIGWNTVPVTVTVAARFPMNMTVPHAGMQLSSVDLFVNDLNATGSNQMTVKIYGMGTSYEPGTLLYSQNFTPLGANWEHIVLTTPVTITGADIWVGYTFTQTSTGIFIPGTDAGPSDPNGDFLSTGVGWSHLSNNPLLAYNWNIRANLTGSPLEHWLSVAPTSGTTVPAGTSTVQVTCNATNLTAGVYTAKLRILSNDPATSQLDVPVTLDVSVGIIENTKVSVMVYPNPAKNILNIKSSSDVKEIRIINLSGQIVYQGTQTSISVSSLPIGLYTVQTITNNGISNIKFYKE